MTQQTTQAQRKSLLLLVMATAMWGLGFVATQHTLASMHPLWSNALRFLVAVPVALVLFRKRVVWDRPHLQAAALASLFLTGAFIFQTWGLKYTTVGKSSLITGLYAVITPMVAPLFNAPRPRPMHILAAIIAVTGMAILGNAWDQASGGLNLGDLLTLGCAVVTACHIHIVAKVAPGRDAMGLNTLQILGCAGWSILAAVPFGGPVPLEVTSSTWLSMGYLAAFSTVIAFGIQLKAQQTLTPSATGILLLMEAPFGVLFGVLLLGDLLGPAQLAGGAIMLAGCMLSVKADAAVTAEGQC